MAKALEIFGSPKFIIYKAENGWALFVPKDETFVQEYGDMVSKMMGNFGMADPMLENARKSTKDPSLNINGLFLFDSFEELVGFIKVEFEQFVETKK